MGDVSMKSIKCIKGFYNMPLIFEDEYGRILQRCYIDKSGKFRSWKEIVPKKHNGIFYWRINKIRYSKDHLESLSFDLNEVVNLYKVK